MRPVILPPLMSIMLLLGGCIIESDTPELDTELGIDNTGFAARFAPANAIIPFPNNLLFKDTLDGTLNIPLAGDASDGPKIAMNALDGFSTIAPITSTFAAAIAPGTLNGNTVRLFDVTLSGVGGIVTGINSELTYGVDFIASVSSIDNKTLAIIPLKPLAPKTSYVVALTTSIQSTTGLSATADGTYVYCKSETPLVDGGGVSLVATLSDADATALEPLRQLTYYQELALAGAGIDKSTVALSWTFTTQSAGDVLTTVRAITTSSSSITTTSVGTTFDYLTAGPGLADVYIGTLNVPYYLTAGSGAGQDTAPLTTYWQALNAFGGENNLTNLNPLPVATSTETIPLLLTIPKTGSAPWPVVIFQHDITGNRSNMLAAADALAAAGFAVVATDLPLHGITPDSPYNGTFLQSGSERTFDLDFVNNTTSAPLNFSGGETPDGIDKSGTHFINLASLLTTRDNIRQGVADLFALTDALATMDYDGGGADFDTNKIYFVGHSLGAMVGSVFLAKESNARDAVLAMPGGGIAKLLDGSLSFGPIIAAGLAANDVIKGTADYEGFMGAAQTAIDSGDPLNYATGTVTGRGVLLFEVNGDLVVPNNVYADAPAGTVPSPTAGTTPLATAMGLTKLSASDSGTDLTAWVRFTAGDHGSVLDPSADAAVTTEMQTQMATFLASDGAIVPITNSAVVE